MSLMGPSSVGTEPSNASNTPQHVVFLQTRVKVGVPYLETVRVSLLG